MRKSYLWESFKQKWHSAKEVGVGVDNSLAVSTSVSSCPRQAAMSSAAIEFLFVEAFLEVMKAVAVKLLPNPRTDFLLTRKGGFFHPLQPAKIKGPDQLIAEEKQRLIQG